MEWRHLKHTDEAKKDLSPTDHSIYLILVKNASLFTMCTYMYHQVVHFKYVILALSYTSVKLEKNEKENASLQEKSLENSKKHKILQVKIKEGCCCFWTVVLQKTLQSPLDSKELNQLILKEINPEYSLEGPML